MKKSVLFFMLLAILAGCKQKTEVKEEAAPAFVNQLTDAEKKGGVMTPEILWKFGRLGSVALSPDGTSVLYTVTEYQLDSQINRTNIFKIPVAGGEAMQLTTDGGSSPQWISEGNAIAYVADGKLRQ
jgi:Tol biopolymer transport system component